MVHIKKLFMNSKTTCLVMLISLICIKNSYSKDFFKNAEKLTSDQLVIQVLKHNPEILVKQALVDASHARIKQVSALADPILSYSVAPETYNKSNQDFGQKFMLTQKIPWPGKRHLSLKTQTYETEAIRYQVSEQYLNLTQKARNAYADWYYAHAALAINQRSKTLWKTFIHLAEVNYSTGRASKQDVLKAEVESYQLDHQEIVLTRKIKKARSRINELLNRKPDAYVPPPSSKFNLKIDFPDIETLTLIALQNRPEIQILNEQINAAKSRIKQTHLDDYPDFNLQAGYNSLLNQDNKRWTVGVSMNIPIDSGKRQAAKGEAKASLIRLQTQLDLVTHQIQSEVQNALDAVTEAQHIIQLHQQHLIPSAKENLTTSQSEYASSVGDFLSLISAEKSLYLSELEYEKAKVALYKSIVELQRTAVINPYENQHKSNTEGSSND